MLICLYFMTAQCKVQDFIWLVTLPVVDIMEHEWNWIEYSQSGCCGQKENLLPLPRIKPRFFGHPACILVSIMTELSWHRLSVWHVKSKRQQMAAGEHFLHLAVGFWLHKWDSNYLFYTTCSGVPSITTIFLLFPYSLCDWQHPQTGRRNEHNKMQLPKN
jgi:hypothetical protein